MVSLFRVAVVVCSILDRQRIRYTSMLRWWYLVLASVNIAPKGSSSLTLNGVITELLGNNCNKLLKERSLVFFLSLLPEISNVV